MSACAMHVAVLRVATVNLNSLRAFLPVLSLLVFFFNDPATTEIYTLSLHDALPIFKAEEIRILAEKLITLAKKGDLSARRQAATVIVDHEVLKKLFAEIAGKYADRNGGRSEEHTSELQSRPHLVCRLLLEKKKKK